MKTYCGMDCCGRCPRLSTCGGCESCDGHPFGGQCVARNAADFSELKSTLINEINALRIDGLRVNDLNLLNGCYADLEYTLPNGTSVRFLNADDVYLGNQVERTDSERCFGVVANETFILVCEYGCGGAEPTLLLYKHRNA